MSNINIDGKSKAQFDNTTIDTRKGTEYPESARSFKSAYSPATTLPSPAFPEVNQYTTFYHTIPQRSTQTEPNIQPRIETDAENRKTDLLFPTNKAKIPINLENPNCCSSCNCSTPYPASFANAGRIRYVKPCYYPHTSNYSVHPFNWGNFTLFNSKYKGGFKNKYIQKFKNMKNKLHL